MVAQVAELHPQDTAYFDEDILNALSRDLGPSVAENILCRALEELSERMSHMRAAYMESDLRNLRKIVRSTIPIMDQVGLPKLTRVAKDVLICADRNDSVALAATLCRLLRCSDMAIACAEVGMDLSL